MPDAEPISRRVFISHASEDHDLVHRLGLMLHNNKIDTFIDEWEIGFGESIRRKIEQGLADCSHFAVVLSPNSIGKEWVNREIDAAFVRDVTEQAKFVPLLYNLSINQVPPFIAALSCLPIDDSLTGVWPLIHAVLDIPNRPPLYGDSPEPPLDWSQKSAVSELDDQPIAALKQNRLPPRRKCIGRDDVVENLVQAMIAENPLPAAVLGGPGMGKTTVCLAVLYDERVISRFGNRSVFVRLNREKTATEAVAKIAKALKIDSDEDPLDFVIRKLKEAPTLLTLYSAEMPWLMDAKKTETVFAHLASVQGSTFLASFLGRQSPLGLQWGELTTLEALSREDNQTLFLELLGSMGLDFATGPELEKILQKVEGLPLAIELMARRAQGLRHFGGLLSLWESEKTKLIDEPVLFARRSATKPSGFRFSDSLKVAIDDPRMTEGGRHLLAILGLLPHGLSDTDLAALLPENGPESKNSVIITGMAFEGTSVTQDAIQAFGESEVGRIRLLAPIREWVRTRSPDTPLSQTDLERTVSHFVDLALSGNKVGWAGGAEAASRLAAEATNIENLLEVGLTLKDPLPAIAAVTTFGRFQRFAGVGTTRLLESAAKVARNRGEALLEAECLRILASILRIQTSHERAIHAYKQAQAIYQVKRDDLGDAHCIRGLADTARAQGNKDRAQAFYGEALQLYKVAVEKLTDKAEPWLAYKGAKTRFEEIARGKANCIERLGDNARMFLRYTAAENEYMEARELYRQIDDLIGEASCIKGIGDVAMSRKSQSAAEDHYNQALKLYREVPFRLGEANCLYSLGDISLIRTDYFKANEHYQAAYQLYDQIQSSHGKANCMYSIGDILLLDGQYDEAVWRYGQARQLYLDFFGDHVGAANCSQGLRDVACKQSSIAEMRRREIEAKASLRRAFSSFLTPAFKIRVTPAFGPLDLISQRWRR